MKKRIWLLIIFFIIITLVIICSINILHISTVNEYQTGYLVWADQTINVYNYASNTKKEYIFEEYNCSNIGKYYGGDFCCIGYSNEDAFALLFGNGIMEDAIYLPYNTEQVASLKDEIIFRSGNQIYSLDRYSDKCKLLVDNANSGDFYLNENGDIAFIRTEKDISTLYVYSNDKEINLGNATQIMCWSSNEEVIVKTFDSTVAETDYGSKTTVISKTYIVNIKNNFWKETSLYKDVRCVSAWTLNNQSICWFKAIDSTEYYPLGFVDLNTRVRSKWALDNDVIKYDEGPTFFEWFEGNPMKETQDDGSGTQKDGSLVFDD